MKEGEWRLSIMRYCVVCNISPLVELLVSQKDYWHSCDFLGPYVRRDFYVDGGLYDFSSLMIQTCYSDSIFLTTFAGTPTAIEPGGTDSITTEPAPIIE